MSKMTLWQERNSELMTVLRLVEKLCAWVRNLVFSQKKGGNKDTGWC